MVPFIFVLMLLGGGVGLYFFGLLVLVIGAVVFSPVLAGFAIYHGLIDLFGRSLDAEPLVVASEPVWSSTIAAKNVATTSLIDVAQSEEERIDKLKNHDIELLLLTLPYGGFHTADFEMVDGQWSFKFNLNSAHAHFAATGIGHSPEEAFMIAKQIVHKQTRDWHHARENKMPYDAVSNEFLLPNDKALTNDAKIPTVLIVDDDIDAAAALETIFRQLGCLTNVITDPNEIHRHLSFNESDFIVLDWMLGDRLRGNQVIERAVRVIDSFADLREKFEHCHPRVITHSVLDRSKIALPDNTYFAHLDHWQKPISYNELTARSAELLEASGF
jgi:CheY-like chemotaxis protein